MAVYPYSVFRIQVGWTEGEVLGGAIKCTLLVFYTLYLNSPVALDHTHYSVPFSQAKNDAALAQEMLCDKFMFNLGRE